VAGMSLIHIGRHWRSEWGLTTMVQWMATRFLCGFSYCLMAKRPISINVYQWTCRVSWTWRRGTIQWDESAQTWII
jgi:hypothetical protein